MTMVWRAIARVRFSRNQWTWTEICSCVGGICFSISDAIIGFDRFVKPIPHAQVLKFIIFSLTTIEELDILVLQV